MTPPPIDAPTGMPETWWYCNVCHTARGAALSFTAADPICCGKPMTQMIVKELD